MRVWHITSIIAILIGVKLCFDFTDFQKNTNEFKEVSSHFNGALITSISSGDASVFENYKDEYIEKGSSLLDSLILISRTLAPGITSLIIGMILLFDRSRESLFEFFKNVFDYVTP